MLLRLYNYLDKEDLCPVNNPILRIGLGNDGSLIYLLMNLLVNKIIVEHVIMSI